MALPITRLSFTAITLGLRLEELSFAAHVGDGSRYQMARKEIEGDLRQLGLAGSIPADPGNASDQVSDVLLEVAEFLGREKESGVDPDAVAFFAVAMTPIALIASILRGDSDRTNHIIVTGALEALGLDGTALRELERDAGLLRGVAMSSSLPPEAATSLMSGAAQNFLEIVVEEFGWRGSGVAESRDPEHADGQVDGAVLRSVSERLGEIQGELANTHQSVIDTRQDLAGFLAVYQASNQRLEELVRSGDRRMEELLGQIASQMVRTGGVDMTEAQRATAGEPSGFFERLTRWLAKSQPVSPIEAAMWAALDFVPGGTGVKLGVAVMKAVRQSLQ